MSTTQEDVQMIVWLSGAGSCSLDSSPGKNWVENAGGLPNYICKIAKAVMKTGKSKSASIAIAVSRVKKWAAGGSDVDADTRVKAAAAVAEWEKLKGKNKAGKLVKASRQDGSEYIQLSNIGSFNTDMVRRAWNAREQAQRMAQKAQHGERYYDLPLDEKVPYTYIKETWTDFILVEMDDYPRGENVIKVPYTVNGLDVEFGDPIQVKQVWVETDTDLSDEEKTLLDDILSLSASAGTAEERIAALGKKLLDANGNPR